MEFTLDQAGIVEVCRRAVPRPRAAQRIAAEPAQLPGLVLAGSSFSGGHGSSELRLTIGLPVVSQGLARGNGGHHCRRQIAFRTLRQRLGPSLTGAGGIECLEQPGAHRQGHEIERGMNQCGVDRIERAARLAERLAQTGKLEPGAELILPGHGQLEQPRRFGQVTACNRDVDIALQHGWGLCRAHGFGATASGQGGMRPSSSE